MDNPERFRELDSRWRKENKDRVSAHQRAYRKRRPEKLLAKNSARRARTVEAMPSDFSDFDAFVIEEAARACRRRAKLHGEPFHIDHMIPLAAGGEHRATNIQVIPARLNLWKGDRLVLTQPGEWIAHA
jgi:hypothetical protein